MRSKRSIRAAFLGLAVLAGGFGTTNGTTMVASGPPVPAVVTLDPTGCNALQSFGVAGVRAYAHPDGNVGWIANDTDGSKAASTNACGTTAYTMNMTTSSSTVWACGAPYDSGASSACPAGGVIETAAFDPGQTTCLAATINNACNPSHLASGQLRPTPLPATAAKTRAIADHEWNCKPTYPDYTPYGAGAPPVSIAGCSDTTQPFIDQLAALVGPTGTPAGFAVVTNCFPAAGTIFLPGNYRIACPTFAVNGDVTFLGGNLIFDGNLAVNAGHLRVNTANPIADVSSACRRDASLTEACLAESSQRAAFLHIRGAGAITKGSAASLTLNGVAVHLDPTAPPSSGRKVDFPSGTGSLTWTAPAQAGSPDAGSPGWFFDKLALWSESSAEHRIAGASNSQLRGVSFTPQSFLSYVMGNDQYLENAQFITFRMAVSGTGILRLAPNPASTLSVVPEPPDTTITSGPPSLDTSADATLEYLADRPGATFSCSLDGGAFAACPSPHNLTLGEGLHELLVAAVDPWGQIDATPASWAWTIDLTPPETIANLPTPYPSGWYGGPVAVTLSASDVASNVVGTFYRLDGGPDVAYAGEFVVSGGGAHELVYWSIDEAGRVEDENVLIISIDDVVPSITFLDRTPEPDAEGWNNGPVTIRWSCADAETGVVAEIVETTVSTEGEAQSAVGVCEDVAGNQSSDTVEGINIDTSGPTVTIDEALVAVGAVTGSASDGLSGASSVTVVYTDLLGAEQTVLATCAACETVGTPLATWSAEVPIAPGLYQVSVFATDWAGNVGASSVVGGMLLVPTP